MPTKTIKKKAGSKKIPLKPKELVVDFIDEENLDYLSRKGYTLHFVHPKNEELLNELRNTGKACGEMVVSSGSLGDQADEVLIVVRD